jgi:hypothetical protein
MNPETESTQLQWVGAKVLLLLLLPAAHITDPTAPTHLKLNRLISPVDSTQTKKQTVTCNDPSTATVAKFVPNSVDIDCISLPCE